MERDNRNAALKNIMSLAKTKGFVTFDDLLETADTYSLSIGDLDWLSEAVHSRNVIVYDDAPDKDHSNQDDFDDYAQTDYEETFNRVIALNSALSPFIDSIRSITPPQRGEVSRLKFQVFEGNEHARTRMIEMYMRLAVRIAYQRSTTFDYDIEEAIGDACIGLVTAVDKYDPFHSGPFVSFASMWIFQSISRRQPTQNPNLYFPVHRKDLYFAVYPYLKQYGCIECDQLGKCAKVADMICKKTGCSTVVARDVIMSVQRCDSFDKLIESILEDERFVLPEDVIMDGLDEYDKKIMIRSVLDKLSDRQRDVIRGRFGFDDGKEKTLEQLGQYFGLTRERIRQIEEKAMRKIKAYIAKAKKSSSAPHL